MTQPKSRLAKLTPPTLPVVLTRARLFRVLDRARTCPDLDRALARIRQDHTRCELPEGTTPAGVLVSPRRGRCGSGHLLSLSEPRG